MSKKDPSKGGRPTKFDKSQMLLIEYMAKEGKTDKEIADALGVAIRTFYGWKIANKEYMQPLNDWKKEADKHVERSLYERACGYSVTETKTFCHEGMIITEDIKKNFPPDPTSMIFWLKNRQPKDWRDKVETEHSSSPDKPVSIVINQASGTRTLEEIEND